MINTTYAINGMTCQSCQAKVTNALSEVSGVEEVRVDLESNEALISMSRQISELKLQQSLPKKYTLETKETFETISDATNQVSKLQQLKPLFLILLYISIASILLHKKDWNLNEVMIDFMGLFFIVFSFFKMLDIKGFASSFIMYDPIANLLPIYARTYPFLETILGLMLLLRYKVTIALVLTIVILGFTTYGVTKTLLSKRKIQCACLGTALNLPMTEATFIENALMILMAATMLVNV